VDEQHKIYCLVLAFLMLARIESRCASIGFLQPFLLMIFFSTTFSPGAGVPGINNLRYLFTRFYFWCRVPVVRETMEGCPTDDGCIGLALLTGCVGPIIFGVFQLIKVNIGGRREATLLDTKRAQVSHTQEFELLQQALLRGKNGGIQA